MSFELIIPDLCRGGKNIFLTIPDNLKIIIGEKYSNGITIGNLSDEYNMSRSTVGDILRACQIPKKSKKEIGKKYEINENYFEKIDSHEKAYILGFIMGDGNISNDVILRIELNSKDEEILHKIKNSIRSSAPIKRRTRERKGTKTYSSFICFCCKKICQDLISNYGMSGNKTEHLSYPKIPLEFDNSFILGIFDADGSIRGKSTSKDKWSSVVWDIIATRDMGRIIYEKLLSFNINVKYKDNNYFKIPLSNVQMYDKYEIIKLREILYKNSSIYLERKHKAFLNVKIQEKK